VDTEIHSSDHYSINISIIPRIHDNNNIALSRWNLKNPNWQKFTDTLHNEIETQFTLDINDPPDKLIEKFNKLITNTAEKIIKKCHNNNKPKVPWWNENI
jgi:hypothetical protein